MTSEERLDRLERFAMLMTRAGFRARRDLNEKISIVIDAQIKTEERFARLAEAQERTDGQLNALVDSQKSTDERLNTLIDIIRHDRNGNSG